MLGDRRFIRSITLRNFLSFGSEPMQLEARSLNVLIGPNASGKSNLIEALGLLNAAPKDLTAPIREGGGIAEWLWKGASDNPVAEIEVTVQPLEGDVPLRHRLSFAMVGLRTELVDEAIENERPDYHGASDVRFYYRYQQGKPVLNLRMKPSSPVGGSKGRAERRLKREDLELNQSVLSQKKDPDLYPEITYLGVQYSKMKLYREWNLGRHTAPRNPQQVDAPEDFLAENASNLGLVLNNLENRPGVKKLLSEKLRLFGEGVDDITLLVHGGTIQIYLHEQGLSQAIPATRLSDGTLRYICLLAVLCHPSPPSVVCIEEPELGLHPDILPTIAELLVDASSRTQLFVTTHSEILVDALTNVPESVVVCEKHEGATRMRRLNSESLKAWLEKYTLGQLWRRGELGGNRW
jgi:predicted ATPase